MKSRGFAIEKMDDFYFEGCYTLTFISLCFCPRFWPERCGGPPASDGRQRARSGWRRFDPSPQCLLVRSLWGETRRERFQCDCSPSVCSGRDYFLAVKKRLHHPNIQTQPWSCVQSAWEFTLREKKKQKKQRLCFYILHVPVCLMMLWIICDRCAKAFSSLLTINRGDQSSVYSFGCFFEALELCWRALCSIVRKVLL